MTLTARQQATLKKHAAHHSAKHMAMMKKQMRQGSTSQLPTRALSA